MEISLQQCIGIIKEACSGVEAFDFVQKIATFHRPQASSGYRAAAERVLEILHENGLEAVLRRYPADGKTHCFTQKLFKEWNCQQGWLEITNWSKRIADYDQEEMSIIQRSADRDCSNQEIPIVFADADSTPANFTKPLNGTLLFVENGFEKWSDLAIEQGALGIITVSIPEVKPVRLNMSTDPDLADAHGNLNFHIYDQTRNTLCGFAISPSNGQRLREECLALACQGRMPTARFKIASSFTAGTIENIEAVIRGESDEEILLVAHLCHPRSSVNDNASGVGSSMAAMCTLQRLINQGILPRPKRTIRLLLMPEFTGTYAFLQEQEHRLKKIKAGVNLDMVAGDQSRGAGPNIIVDTPDCAHSFCGDLATIIMEELLNEGTFGSANARIPLSLGLKVPFTGGSDHYILSDPTVDIPTIAWTQWPDKTYHTSADRLEHIDPNLLRRAAALAGSYCYLLARFTVGDAKTVLQGLSTRFVQRWNELRWLPQGPMVGHGDYLQELYLATLDRMSGFFSGVELGNIQSLIEAEKTFFLSLPYHSDAETNKQLELSPIPIRLFKAPLALSSIREGLSLEQKQELDKLQSDHSKIAFLMTQVIYATDGQRTVLDIARRMYYQMGLECTDYVQKLFGLLVDLGFVKFINPA